MTDLLKKDHQALNEEITKLQAELNQIKVKSLSRKNSDDTSKAAKLRKQIARVQTAINYPQPVKKIEKAKKEQDK